jgi:GTP1/Obg family GTP-binding protein
MEEVNKSNDIPDDVKNQIVDGKQRVITENIPQNFLEDIEKENKKMEQLSHQFFSSSRQHVKLGDMLQELETKLHDAEEMRKKIYEHAFNKLKLAKRKDYRWQLKGNSFVGILNIPPKPQEEVK